MNNVIYADQNYIAGLSEEFKAELHRHPVLEIYAACEGESHVRIKEEMIAGQIIMIAPDTLHAISDDGKRGIAIFVDPLSAIGYSIKEHHLHDKSYGIIECSALQEPILSLMQNDSPEAVQNVSGKIIEILKDETIHRCFDQPVLEAIELVSKENEDFTMTSLADRIFLSKSRLAHLFSEQTGITLKSYLQYKRLEKALRKMMSGSSITEAALDTGFAGSSHISVSGRKMTGMQIRKLLNI